MSTPVVPLRERDMGRSVVLVVSDCPDFCRQVGEELEARDVRVREGRRSTPAGRLETGDVDLIVLDLEHPTSVSLEDLDGIPTVVVTGSAESDEGVALLRAGAADLIPRPFHPPLLAERVRRILRRTELAIDPLTGVATMVAFRAEVRRAIARAQRAGHCVAIVLLGLKGLHRINEEYGHEVGDRLLRGVADRLVRAIRDYDAVAHVSDRHGISSVVSRLGGDRFFVMLEGLEDEMLAAPVVSRLLDKLAEPMRLADGQLSVSARAGISVYPSDGAESGGLLRHAEAALPADRSASGTSIRFFSTCLGDRHRRDLDIESDLLRTIEADSFQLAYQPKISLRDEGLVGFEALLRYEHPRLGAVPAQETIELAERTGLIHPLGEAIFRRVCLDADRLQKATGSAARLFTNFSPRQLESDDWSRRVEGVLEETGMDPTRVGIEITESVLLGSRPPLIEALHRFSQWGLEISLDDFGTGYSSLSYLTRLPLDEIKIDGSFITGLTNGNPGNQEIAGLIVMLGRTLDLRVVAECTETREQLDSLSAMGCEIAQGYFFARPRPLETFFDEVLNGQIVPAGDPDDDGRAGGGRG